MKKLWKISAALTIALAASAAQAVPVTINMTGDNILFAGLCADATCQSGATIGLPNASNWQLADTAVFDLGPGTYWFAWNVTNLGAGNSSNPAGLLAEILWDGHASYSSSGWQVFDRATGAFIANATEYGSNGGANIWTSTNGGPVAGISTSANWIYTANNFADADQSAWFRTSISVPEPATLGMLCIGLVGFGLTRRSRKSV